MCPEAASAQGAPFPNAHRGALWSNGGRAEAHAYERARACTHTHTHRSTDVQDSRRDLRVRDNL